MILLTITAILLIVFLANYFLYLILFLKTERKRSKAWDNYTKLYLILWIAPIILIPLITSSIFSPFFNTISYFQESWLWFILLGIILIIVGVKFVKSAQEVNKIQGYAKGKHQLITEGVFKIMRHPKYFAWAIIFLGLALIFDSLIALLLTPFIVLFLEFGGYLEEKYIIIPQFGEDYIKYKETTRWRLFSTPYNYLFLIISIFIIWVGVLNFYVN